MLTQRFSDILAELPIPMSGITSYEELMPPPNYELAASLGFPNRVLESYLGQLHLRKCLNQLHGLLYKRYHGRQTGEGPHLPGPNTVVVFERMMNTHGAWTASHFKFEDTDPPASDILAARLRAKYWGARVILSRAYIKKILDFNMQRRRQGKPPGTAADFINEYPTKDPSAEQILEGARRGLNAHLQSTRAFHGLKARRFIITNPWGTAHA